MGNGVSRGGRPRSRPWRGRPYHRRWPKPPPALPFSHRCSSLRSVCAQDDYIFDEFGSLFCSGSDASAVLCDDDDMSWLNAYGSNDALFPPGAWFRPQPTFFGHLGPQRLPFFDAAALAGFRLVYALPPLQSWRTPSDRLMKTGYRRGCAHTALVPVLS